MWIGGIPVPYCPGCCASAGESRLLKRLQPVLGQVGLAVQPMQARQSVLKIALRLRLVPVDDSLCFHARWCPKSMMTNMVLCRARADNRVAADTGENQAGRLLRDIPLREMPTILEPVQARVGK